MPSEYKNYCLHLPVFFSAINPRINAAKDNAEYKYDITGKFDIDNLFHIMDYKRSSIGEAIIM